MVSPDQRGDVSLAMEDKWGVGGDGVIRHLKQRAMVMNDINDHR